MRAAILGAGVVGVATAWYLRERGWDVDVYDRQPDVGMETSFANGGQISVSHAEPWAAPGVPMKALKWLGQEDAPLLFRPQMDIQQWTWGLKFLRECTHGRWLANTKNLIALGLYSRQALQDLRQALPLAYEQATRGIMHVYTEAGSFEDAKVHAKTMESLGVDRVVLTPEQALRHEPALRHLLPRIQGATYTQSDEQGDALLFTQQLAYYCKMRGVRFHHGVNITKLVGSDGKVQTAVGCTNDGMAVFMDADAFVVARGPHSRKLTEPLGLNIPIYPAKGYSATYRIEDFGKVPTMSMTDESRKVVFSRLGDYLRVAGTAEFNGFNMELNKERCEALDRATRDWFKGGVDHDSVQYWTGLRPATPNNTPWIGVAKPYSNLYWNTGHGTLGWTHGCGSAKGLASIMDGETPDCAFSWKR